MTQPHWSKTPPRMVVDNVRPNVLAGGYIAGARSDEGPITADGETKPRTVVDNVRPKSEAIKEPE